MATLTVIYLQTYSKSIITVPGKVEVLRYYSSTVPGTVVSSNSTLYPPPSTMADQYTSIPVAKVIEGSPNQERTSLLGAKPSPSSSSAQQPAAVRFQTGEGYIPEEIEKQLRRGFL